MVKRNQKKPSPGHKVPSGPARSSRPRRAASSTSPGWKPLLAFVVIAVLAAGTGIWYKVHKNTQLPADNNTIADAPAVTFPDNTGPEAGYIGDGSCAECHAGIAESYSHIAMGRSLYRPTIENIIEDYEANNQFFHEPSGQYFRMTNENGRFFQTRFQKDPDGSVINEKKVEINYIIGSGNHSRSYLHREPGGEMYQLPVAWYPQEKKWAMNPGYDNPNHISFSRRITYDCIFCHAAYPDVPAGADQNNFAESSFFPEKLVAIDCERCHGPAAQHVKLAKGGAAEAAIREAILNPANLSNKLQLEVCMQCHLETTSGKLPHSVHAIGKGIYGYRPGEPLEEYRYAFDHPKGVGHDDKFEIAGQAYRMRMSPCFTESEGRMTCTTCHDPHRVPKDRIAAAIQSCLECHAPVDCTESMEIRLPVQDNCIQCHMPTRRTDDVIHVTMTDHYIQRRPPPPEVLLAPKKEHHGEYRGEIVPYYPKEIAPEVRDLYLGIAYISNSADLEKGINFLDSYLQDNPTAFAALYTRSVALKILRKMEQARVGLEKAVELRPRYPQAWMALGDLLEMMGDYDRAVECYRTAAKIDPRLSRARNGAGTSLLMAGKIDAAEKEFRAAVTLDPFDENPHLNISAIYLRRGNFQAAEAEARAALAIAPNNADGWKHMAQCALALDRPKDTIWTSLESLSINESNPQVYELLLAACQAMAGKSGTSDQSAAAITALQQAANRAPFAAHIAIGLTQLEQNNATAAASSLAHAAAQSTTTAALPAAVRVALNVNRRDLALTWGEQAHHAMPKNEEATIRYAAALRAADQSKQAVAILQKSLTEKRAPRILNALAWLHATTNDPALRDGQKAAGLSDEAARMLGQPNIFILQTQAAAAAEQGRFQQAVATAQQALTMAQNANLNIEARKIQQQLANYQTGKPHHANW